MGLHAVVIFGLAAMGLPFMFRAPPHNPPSLAFAPLPMPTPKQILHAAAFLSGSGEKFVISVVLWGAALSAMWRERASRDRDVVWRDTLLVLWAIVPVALLALFSFVSPMFAQRYMIFCLPATLMLAGRGMVALPKWRLGLWLVIALCFFSVVNIFLGYRKPREDWRSATAAVLGSAAPGDAVVIYPFYMRTGFDYYYDRQRATAPNLHTFPRYDDRGEDEQSFRQSLSDQPRAFRHVWVLMRDGPGGKGNLQDYAPELSAQLQAVFGQAREMKFQGLTLLEYGG